MNINPKFTLKSVSFSVAVCLSLASHAQQADTQAALDNLKENLVVTATRTEKALQDIPATVSVIDADQIEEQLANDISDLIRYEPGVSVPGGGRFGLSGFSIRGIGGDRVLTLVDGTPTADEFSFGPFLSSRRDFVDLDALKSVEIVRGPSSASYGSNAIGGIVNFVTKDPADYLDEKSFAGSIKVNYGSVDESTNATLLTAFGNQSLSTMIVATGREFSETETFFNDDSSGSDRRSQNPQDGDTQNLFLKTVYAPSDQQKLSLTLESFDSSIDTDVLSSAGNVVRGTLVESEQGIDERERSRISVNYQLKTNAAIADQFSVLAYSQESEAEQLTLSNRVSPRSGPQARTRSSQYEQDNVGVRLQANKLFRIGDSSHQLSYGFDYDKAESETLRNGSTVNLSDGSLAREFSAFPTRDFPNSEYVSQGIFIQDDIAMLGGRLSIIPSIRYDDFELTPEADEVYLGGNPGAPTPEGFDESKTSVRLGVLYDLSDKWSVFAQYAEGFRAPSLDAVNVGFTNFAGGYTTLPNPNLQPEEAEGIEFGVRHNSEFIDFDLVFYQNDYTNFIESLATLGFNPATQLLEFQARNLPEAQIEGVEMKLRADLAGISPSLQGFQARASYAYSDGENQADNTPINSVDPQQLVLGLSYTAPESRWGVESVLTLVDRKDAADIDASGLQGRGDAPTSVFEAPGYGVLDLIGYVNVTPQLRVNLAMFNVTDKQHFSWSESLVQDPATTNFDRLTQAGRNYSISLKYQF